MLPVEVCACEPVSRILWCVYNTRDLSKREFKSGRTEKTLTLPISTIYLFVCVDPEFPELYPNIFGQNRHMFLSFFLFCPLNILSFEWVFMWDLCVCMCASTCACVCVCLVFKTLSPMDLMSYLRLSTFFSFLWPILDFFKGMLLKIWI